MRKYTTFFFLVLFCFIAVAISLKYLLVNEAVRQIQTFTNNLDSRYVQIKYDVQENTCIFAICVKLKDIRIKFINKSIYAGDILVEMPIDYPLMAFISTEESNRILDFTINAILSNNQMEILNASSQIDNFSLELKGIINTQNKSVQMQATTNNLGHFIVPYMPEKMRGFIRLFFTNEPQLLSIEARNGWLTLQGIPLFHLNVITPTVGDISGKIIDINSEELKEVNKS